MTTLRSLIKKYNQNTLGRISHRSVEFWEGSNGVIVSVEYVASDISTIARLQNYCYDEGHCTDTWELQNR